MKRLYLFFLSLGAVIAALGADVKVTLSGLEDSRSATISIASYTYLETIEVSGNGDFVFRNVPAGKHYVKAEAPGYNTLEAQCVEVREDGSVLPPVATRLVVTKQSTNPDEWKFTWREDGSPSGYTTTSHVNKPAEIEFLGKKIVPADVPSAALLEQNYHIYLVDDKYTWTQEYAYRLLETLKTLPVNYSSRRYASFKIVDGPIVDDIVVNDHGDGYEVEISKDVFYYANPFLVNLDGVRGRLFSKRLHHALTNFVTDFGRDTAVVDQILSSRFGCHILGVNYEELTRGITNEDAGRFQEFFPSELVSIINMLEELPEGFHATPHLNYLIRRVNGMPHPLYPTAAAVSWPVDNGYIEFMESAFGGNNQDFETLRLILHEKTHFLWAYTFSDEIKNDWIEVGGWYEDPNAAEGWSTTKDVEFVSAYAHAKNPNEDMAESVAFYLRNPDMLMSRSPEKYEFICNRIMHGTRYISKILDHLTFEVLNLHPDYDYPGKIKSLDVTCSGAPDEDKMITVEIELNHEDGYDDAASSAYVRLYSPDFICSDGTTGGQFVDVLMYPINEAGYRVQTGHRLRGYSNISKYSKRGHWTAGDIKVSDIQGNQRFEGRNDCVFDLYVNNPLEDVTPPKYEGDLRYILTDTIIEGHKARNLQARFNISDSIGFSRVMCRLQVPGSTYSKDYDGYFDETTGEGVVNIPITEYFRTGDYYISNILLDDLARNSVWITFSNSSLDHPISSIHIETADPDTTNPEVDLARITVYAEPTHPEAPDGETLVTIAFYARDDKSGFGKCNYRLRDPQGIDHFEWFYHRNFGSLYFDGDPTVWERYLIKVILPKGSVPGIWGLSQMTIADKAFNELTYNFVETLIFEPDDSDSDYVLFSELGADNILDIDLQGASGASFGFTWRVIHEESGVEISGASDDEAAVAARAASLRAVSARRGTSVDVSSLADGDLIVIVNVLDAEGNVMAVKTNRVLKSATTGHKDVVSTPICVDVYNLQGIAVKRSVDPSMWQSGLPAGIYIVNGKKYAIR